MTAFDKLFHAREHRERAQPKHREGLGILEKKKDYQRRARDQRTKRDTLKRLGEKARLKNPDEFYFRMASTQTLDGVHQAKEPESHLSREAQLLARTQTRTYVRMRAQQDAKKIERLRATQIYPGGSRTLYGEDGSARQAGAAAAAYRQDPEALREIEVRTERQQQLERVERAMELDRNLAGRTPRKRVGRTDGVPAYKWSQQRLK